MDDQRRVPMYLYVNVLDAYFDIYRISLMSKSPISQNEKQIKKHKTLFHCVVIEQYIIMYMFFLKSLITILIDFRSKHIQAWPHHFTKGLCMGL
jgi:hypothetical protein